MEMLFPKKHPVQLQDGEYPLPMVHLGQYSGYPLAPDQRPLLCAGRTKKPSLAGKGHEIVMPAVRAARPGKAVLHDSAVQVFPDR